MFYFFSKMLVFKCGLIVLTSTYVMSLCLQIVQETSSWDTGLAFLYVASGVMAGKIIYDRYQQIHILGPLTPNPHVTSFANKIASYSASLLSVGFLAYVFLFIFKVDSHFLVALSIFIFGSSTLYIWIQCIITTYFSTMYYDQQLCLLRQYLANLSFVILLVMAVLGMVTSFVPKGASAIYICFVVTSLCGYILAGIFCVFILSFEKEYQYFAQGPRSDALLPDECSEASSEVESIYGTQKVSNTNDIKDKVNREKVS